MPTVPAAFDALGLSPALLVLQGCDPPGPARAPAGDVETLLLDEAGRRLDLGFDDEVTRLLALLRERRPTLMVPGTRPEALAVPALRDAATVGAAPADPGGGALWVPAVSFIGTDAPGSRARLGLIEKRLWWPLPSERTTGVDPVGGVKRRRKSGTGRLCEATVQPTRDGLD